MVEHYFGVISFLGEEKVVVKEFDHVLNDEELFREFGKLFEKGTECVTLRKTVTAQYN